MTSPVFQALVNSRLQQLNRDEAAISESVDEVLGPPPPDTFRPEHFIKWCDEQSLPWRPASPAIIAKFVLGHTKIGKLLEEMRCISEAHTTTGLPDPTAAWQVTEAILRLTAIAAPRSWPGPMKVLFLSLPPDLQRYLSISGQEREAVLRRAQTLAAEAKRQLAAIQKPEETKDGVIENQPVEARVA